MAVMGESTALGDFKANELVKSCRYFKMKKIKDLKAKTAEKLIRDFTDKDAILQADDVTTYSKFEDLVAVHVPGLSSTKEGKVT